MSTSIEASLRLEIAQYQAQLARAQGEAAKFKTKLKEKGRDLGETLFGGIGKVVAAGAFVGLGKQALDVVASFDRLERGMNSLEGSAEAAKHRMDELREASRLPGLDFEQAVQGDIRLRSVGISAELSKKALVEMGNALSLAGGTASDLDGVILALTQIVSKGKVSAEEINQIAERVPQVRAVMKDVFGTADTTAIQDMRMEAEDFISALVDGFGRLDRAQAGLDESLSDIGTSIKVIVNEAAGPIVKEVVPAFAQLANAAAGSKDLIAAIGSVTKATVMELREMVALANDFAKSPISTKDSLKGAGAGGGLIRQPDFSKLAPASTGPGWFNGLVQQGMDAFSGGGKARSTTSSSGSSLMTAMWRDFQAKTREETEAQRKLEELRGRVASEAAAQAFERLDLTQKIATLENEIARHATIAAEAAKQGDESGKLTALMQQLELQRQLNGLLDERQRIKDRETAAKAADMRARLLPAAMPGAAPDGREDDPEKPGKIHGYSRGQPWRGARRSARGFGGLNDLYRMRGTASQWDMLQRGPSAWASLQAGADQRDMGLSGRHADNAQRSDRRPSRSDSFGGGVDKLIEELPPAIAAALLDS